ncbi:MAG: hypothetical protein ABJN26_13385 [Stappiaceae bacterium]
MSKNLIIGIHGLANKPPESELTEWWEASIREGLLKNEKVSDPAFDFKMIYWAGRLYKNPLHREPEFHFDQLFNREPYVEAEEGSLKSKKDGFLDAVAAKSFDLGGETLDLLKGRFGFNSLADAFLGKLLKDLNLYYENKKIRLALRSILTDALLANPGRKIMIVAHSMGSIIAYDVLTLLGQSHPNYEVDHFVTIGSPLGLPHVKGKIIEEFVHRGTENERVRTPSVVKNRWVNYADRKDPVALDVHLADDYGKNRSDIVCDDDLVHNDYRIMKWGEDEPSRNYHKSYGYLRTPEFSRLVREFI